MTANQATIEYALKLTRPATKAQEPMTLEPITITCKCGTSFEWTPTQDELSFIDLYKPKLCPPCEAAFQIVLEERHQRDQEERAEQEANRVAHVRHRTIAHLNQLTPERYQATDTGHPSFNLKAWNHIKTWRPTSEVPFLGLIGEPGGCKTRIAYLLFREIVLESLVGGADPISCETATAYDVVKAVRRQNGFEDAAEAARDFLDDLGRARLLLLDDLGKTKNTPSAVAELFAIVDARQARNRPTIWTSNLDADGIASGMAADIGGAFAGRLIECSNIITV